MDKVEIVVSHSERATVRVGEVFLKVDADESRAKTEVDAMARAPIPTPEVLWHELPVLALAALRGAPLGRSGEPSIAAHAAWTATGAALRRLHDAPLPPWPSTRRAESAAHLDAECDWLVSSGVLPAQLVDENRRRADSVFRPWEPSFIHGDLQLCHVFTEGHDVVGVLDWSEAGQGDAMYDLAILTLGHPERLREVIAGYGRSVDLEVIFGWWSMLSLLSIRWLIEHDFDPFAPGCEVDVLRRAP